jgi:hypothetical protein
MSIIEFRNKQVKVLRGYNLFTHLYTQSNSQHLRPLCKLTRYENSNWM